MEATQDTVFNSCNIGKLVAKVVEGYHVTIFAYGQTGSGKTFTMDGYLYSFDQKSAKPVIQVNKFNLPQ